MEIEDLSLRRSEKPSEGPGFWATGIISGRRHRCCFLNGQDCGVQWSQRDYLQFLHPCGFNIKSSSLNKHFVIRTPGDCKSPKTESIEGRSSRWLIHRYCEARCSPSRSPYLFFSLLFHLPCTHGYTILL